MEHNQGPHYLKTSNPGAAVHHLLRFLSSEILFFLVQTMVLPVQNFEE